MVIVRIRQMVALGSVSEHSLLWGAAGTPGTGRLRQVVASYKWSLRQVSLYYSK